MAENVNIADLIFAALSSRRMVVLPSVGAFVRNGEGKVIFSQLLDTDDGVLRALAAEKTGDAMRGDAMVDRFVFDLRANLQDDGMCRIGHYGTMTMTRDGIIAFLDGVTGEAARDDDTHKEQATQERGQTGAEEQEETGTEEEEPSQHPRQKKLYYHRRRRRMDKFLVFAVVVLLLAVAAIAYGVYVSNHTEKEIVLTTDTTSAVTETTEDNIMEQDHE